MPNSVSATVAPLPGAWACPKGASFHVLRHSHASLLLADGVGFATDGSDLPEGRFGSLYESRRYAPRLGRE